MKIRLTGHPYTWWERIEPVLLVVLAVAAIAMLFVAFGGCVATIWAGRP